jgi:hypothetical protein
LVVVPQFTREAQHLLRAPGHFSWSTVTLLALVVYVLHFDGHAALWTVTGTSSFVILIGLTVEISLFFGGGTWPVSP